MKKLITINKSRSIAAIIVIIMLASLLGGCESAGNAPKKDNGQTISQKDESANEINSDEIMSQYNDLLQKSLDSKEVIEFIDKNIGELGKEDADTVILGLEEFLKGTLSFLEDKYEEANKSEEFSKAFDLDAKPENAEKINDAELKKLVEDTYEGGFKLYKSEGDVFPSLDYSFIKRYEKYVSDEMKNYIDIRSYESDNPFSDCFIINVPVEEILKRALKTEEHLLKYNNEKDARTLKKSYELYASYMEAAIIGSGNALIYSDGESSNIRKEVLDSYKDFVENNKDTRTATVLSKYLEVLNKNNNNLESKDIIDFHSKIFEVLRDNFTELDFMF